ncbi:MAG TPA: hypothetical protein VMT20_28445 [Terriglobia bacterium]|nr:hypothetical protein [Terriglobia bacterium]
MDFLKAYLPGQAFATDVDSHLRMTDHEVLSAILEADRNPDSPLHREAQRITRREHFRCLYERNPEDVQVNPEAGKAVFGAAAVEFGKENLRYDQYTQKGGGSDFPVLTDDDRICSSIALSTVLANVPVVAIEYVFVDPSVRARAEKWLKSHRSDIIRPVRREE